MRVVCINDDWPSKDPEIFKNVTFPVKGVIYTVREETLNNGGSRAFRFHEIKNHVVILDDWAIGEPCFPERYFRPVDEKRIEVFRKLLVPVKDRVTS